MIERLVGAPALDFAGGASGGAPAGRRPAPEPLGPDLALIRLRLRHRAGRERANSAPARLAQSRRDRRERRRRPVPRFWSRHRGVLGPPAESRSLAHFDRPIEACRRDDAAGPAAAAPPLAADPPWPVRAAVVSVPAATVHRARSGDGGASVATAVESGFPTTPRRPRSRCSPRGCGELRHDRDRDAAIATFINYARRFRRAVAATIAPR